MKKLIAAGKMLAGSIQIVNGFRKAFGPGPKVYASMAVRNGKQRFEEGLREWREK